MASELAFELRPLNPVSRFPEPCAWPQFSAAFVALVFPLAAISPDPPRCTTSVGSGTSERVTAVVVTIHI